MTYQFGQSSREELDTCDPRLVQIAEKALSYGVLDFSVTQGRRTTEEQKRLYREGRSQLDGVNRRSKHQADPPDLSLAFDFMPYPGVVNGINVWDDRERFARIIGLIQAAAVELGYSVRTGADWDGDGNNADSSLHDMPHIELVE